MKKTVAILSLLLCMAYGSQVHAQFSPLTFGVKGGLNISTMSDDFKSRLRYQVGITLDYQVTNNVYILSGLDFTVMGAKKKGYIQDIVGSASGIDKGKLTTKPMYLKLPVSLAFKFSVAPSTRLFIQSGTYMAVGVGGKSKISGRLNGLKTSSEVNYFGKGKARRFDFGLGVGGGVEHNNLVFSLVYDHGLVNKHQVDDSKAKNRNFALTLGYKFF